MKKIVLILSGLLSMGLTAIAQLTDPPVNAQPEFLRANEGWKPSLEVDGAIDRVPHRGIVVPWAPIRENDVLYKKRVWRIIDVLQRQNEAFRYPGDEESGGGYFIEMLLWAVKNGEITAYAAADDRFTTTITHEEILTKLTGKPDTIEVTNPVTGEVTKQYSRRDFVPTDITKFRIKEDVIFDRNLGREVKRIIGIAPIFDRYDDEGRFKGSQTVCWFYYPKLRPILARYQVYNRDNDVFRITWDDYFEQRRFSSFITKSTMNNFSDDDIRIYKNGVDKLYESERIKEALFNKEHDLWVY